MRLVHFSSEPLGELRSAIQTPNSFKPSGLWVSDEDDNSSWSSWCAGEGFGLDRLTVATEVSLAERAQIMWIRIADEIDDFTARWSRGAEYAGRRAIDWCALAELYQGVVITPYIWSRRLTHHTFWYYGWDCASGCIWDAAAIERVKVSS